VGLDYFNTSSRITDEQEKIKTLTAQKTELEGLKKQVEDYEKRKQVLEQRIKVIEDLRRNKTGGQELLDMVATTVTRTDALWLTSLVRRGNGLTMEGSAASINAVANFITQLKRSGYFDKVEIRESRQDEKAGLLPTFFFTLTAEFVLPQSQAPAAAPRKS
jgi:Tfp pilus assembly protein PilN